MPENNIPDYSKHSSVPTEHTPKEGKKLIQSDNYEKIRVSVTETVDKKYIEGSAITESSFEPYAILRPKRQIIKAIKNDKI
jgi:hypothetical protein